MQDACDSFYKAIKARILTKNSARVVAGMMDAQDWPEDSVKMEAFYCLTLGETPLGKELSSPSGPAYDISVQWVWCIAGTDIKSGVQGRSRGDRARIHKTMQQELLFAVYPLFTEKKIWTADSQGAIVGASLNPKESIWWDQPLFARRIDKPSGLIYGSAQMHLKTVTGLITS